MPVSHDFVLTAQLLNLHDIVIVIINTEILQLLVPAGLGEQRLVELSISHPLLLITRQEKYINLNLFKYTLIPFKYINSL